MLLLLSSAPALQEVGHCFDGPRARWTSAPADLINPGRGLRQVQITGEGGKGRLVTALVRVPAGLSKQCFARKGVRKCRTKGKYHRHRL